MDIEVGDYVRSRNGSIGKVTKIEDDKYLYENKELITFIGNVVKHSKNIIDLIEVGDLLFINGFSYYNFIYIYDETMLEDLKEVVKKDVKIKQILTHEQYMQNCYTVD